MASQLAALSMMSQAQNAAHSVEDQLEMDREKDPAASAPWYATACCGGGEVIGEVPDKTLEEMAAEAAAAKYEKLTLRLNVFSGTNIPASYSTYLGIEITDIYQKHEDFSVNDEGPSRTPSWGQSFEFPLTFSAGMILEVKITVWGRSTVHGNLDRQLGECLVRLPSRQTEWPVMLDTPLLHVPVLSAFGEPEPAKVRLVYELLAGHASPQKALEGASDLLQVASIGDAGSIETSWFIRCSLYKLHLQDLPANESVSHNVVLRIVKRQIMGAHNRREVAGKGKRTGDITQTTNDKGELDVDLMGGEEPASPKGSEALEAKFDSSKPWNLVARRAHLGGYCLEVIVRQVEDKEGDATAGRAVVVGHWEETLANLMGYISEEGCKVRLRAQLAKVNSNTVAGELEFEVDIWDLVEHRPPPEMTVPRLRMGRRPTQSEPRMVYFVLWLDRFAPSSGQEPYPFIRLTIGKNVQIVNATSPDPASDKVIFEPVGILLHASVMRLKIEVLNRIPSITGGSPVEEFIGEVMIRDILPREVYWRHIFAGSPMGHSLEESNLMGKDVKRASTYRCSVGIWMQSTPTVKDDFHLQTFGGAYKTAHLTVRLYQGLYLERFKSTSVKIVVAAGGCDNNTFGRGQTIFTFPGKVDAKGSLYFYGDAKKLHVNKTEYVEQSTNVHLVLPPRVFHAYLYIYKDGADETREAPEVWGRVRVASSFQDNKWKPRWKTMRVDTSASELAPSDFDCNFAGTILAQAALVEGGAGIQAAHNAAMQEKDVLEVVEADVIDFVKGSGWCTATPALKHVPKVAIKKRDDKSQQQKMFCHLDLLTARKVLPMHDVADHKIVFELQVGEQVKTIDGIQQGPSPSLMHRHEIPMDSWNLVGLPVPPVVIQVKKVPISKTMFNAGGKLVCRLGVKTKDLDNDTKVQEGIAEGQIDLNLAHRASWLSLDGRFKQEFNPLDCGGVSPFWKGRPRLLMAVGFSTKQAAADNIAKGLEPDSIPKIVTPKSQKYHIELSLLGLRDLKDQDEEAFLNPNCYVQVESWWEDANESCRLELTNQGLNPELPNPSFRTSNYSGKHRAIEGKIQNMYEHMLGNRNSTDAVKLKDDVKADAKIIHVHVNEEFEVGDDIIIKENADNAKPTTVARTIKDIKGGKITLTKKVGKFFAKESTVTKLGQADAVFLGHRMLLPTYVCPVIPYLQAPALPPIANAGQTQLRTSVEGPNGDGGMVLLPDLLFKLMQRDQFGLMQPVVKAAVSVPLPLRSLAPEDMDPPKWSESTAARFSEEKMVPKLEDPAINDPADPVFDMFVDVFACANGYLKFDDDFRMGRPLADSRMFSIWAHDPAHQGVLSEEAKKEEVDTRKVQRFNPADRGLDVKDTRQHGIAYNRNFVPTFRNGQWTGSVDTKGSERGWINCPTTKLSSGALKGAQEVTVEKLDKAWDVKTGTRVLIGDSHTAHTITEVLEGRTLKLDGPLMKDFKDGTQVKIFTRAEKNRPLEPAKLYRSVEGMRGLTTAHLEELPLRDLKAACADRGFRMCTRLAAPDPVVPTQSKSSLDLLEECNSHTFMRQVGHVVKPAERQSTILARLRMGLPVKAAGNTRNKKQLNRKSGSRTNFDDANQGLGGQTPERASTTQSGIPISGGQTPERDARDVRQEEQQNSCCNFLVIKCLKPAVVIWAPPEEATQFPFPGQLLFVVQLLNTESDDFVEVRVPSIDRRFMNESAWFLGKTLVKGAGETKRKHIIQAVSSEGVEIPDVGDSDDDDAGQEDDSDDDLEDGRGTPGGNSGSKLNGLLKMGRAQEDGPDGYSQAVPVSKWSFVCRLRKRGNAIFHRRQTHNYFTAIMDMYFQEYSPTLLDAVLQEGKQPYKVLDDPQEDVDKMRMTVLEKTLNLRRPLEAVGDDGVAGMIKGHIAIRQHDGAQESDSDDDEWTIVANAGLSGIELEGSGEILTLEAAMKHAEDVGAAAFTQEQVELPKRQSVRSSESGVGGIELPPEPDEDLDQRAKYYFHPTKDGAPRDGEGKQMNLFKRTMANPDKALTSGSPTKLSGQEAVASRKASSMMSKMMARAVPSPPRALLAATCPVNNMWVAKDIRVVISVFSIAHLIPVDYEIRPYITVHVQRPGGGEDTRRLDTLPPVAPGSDCIDVYWQTDVVTELPGSSNMIIRVWHKAGPLGSRDTELGSVTLDLEDRQLALVQREFRVNTSEERLRQMISPPKSVTIDRPSPQDPGFDLTYKTNSKKVQKVPLSKGLKLSIAPRRALAAPAPIEYRQMTLPQPGCVEEPTGILRLCTEFLDARAAFRPAVLSPVYKKIHVSMYINEVKNISVYRDSGERNDVKVVGELNMRDKRGQALPSQTRTTDIHKWAHHIAKFEYYWHFLVDYPLGAASLKLRLFDVDTFSADSEIYHPTTLSMDFMLKTFFEKLQAAPATSTTERISFVEEVVFDAWPADYPERAKMWYKGCMYLWCSNIRYFILKYLCCRKVNRSVPQPKPATLKLRIDMVNVADGYVLDSPEVAPTEVPEGRVNWKTGISNPKDTCLAILGRPNANMLKWLCRGVCCTLCLAVGLAILYFVVMFLANLSKAGG